MLRLLLVRHAESASNAALVLSSALPGPPLTALGHRQTVQLADDLTGEPVRTVCSSAALRAQQTAAPVAAAYDVPVEVVDGLQETFFGDLENRGDNDALVTFYRVYSAWLDGRLDIPMPGGETGRQLVDRFRGTGRTGPAKRHGRRGQSRGRHHRGGRRARRLRAARPAGRRTGQLRRATARRRSGRRPAANDSA